MTASELDKFYEMVDDIDVAMMTTRRPDGHLRDEGPRPGPLTRRMIDAPDLPAR